jgi:hypothetical protein
VHIRRNPFDVYQSTVYMWSKISPLVRLQGQDPRELEERVFRQYPVLYNTFFDEQRLIPAGQLHEIGFEELEQEPYRVFRGIYEALSLPWPERLEQRVRHYLDSIKDYQKNSFRPLPPAIRERILKDWGRGFDEWGYAA